MKKKIKLGTKLVLGFMVPLLAMLGITIGIYVVTGSVKEDVGRVRIDSKKSFEFAILAQEMKLDVVQVQQWLTDISATRGKDGLNDGFDEAEKSMQSFLAGLARFKDVYEFENDKQNIRAIEEITMIFASYYQSGKAMATAYVEGGPSSGNKLMANFDVAAEALNDKLGPFVEHQALKGDTSLMVIVSSIEKLQLSVLIAGLLAVIISFIITWLITVSITKPIKLIIEGLSEGSDQVASASGQISSASQSLAEGASEQAASIEETSASLEEMSSMTKQNADNASHADNLMKDANNVVAKANESMSELTTSIDEISMASEETSKIIKTIDEIAFQTNLLALNAAVEAARAGEAGAGFAVVADEVRNLALRAADAAKNTAELIEGTVKKTKEGTELVARTNEAFSEVSGSTSKVGELVGEIAAASAEQAQGIDQVNKAVVEMDQVTQRNAGSAEESASASEEMSAQADQMLNYVDNLTQLVGGATSGTSVKQSRSVLKPAAPALSSQTNAPIPVRRKVKPNQVIPMDDDFEDF